MMGYTHAVSALLILSLMKFSPFYIFLGVFAVLLPDIDNTNSLIGRMFFPVSRFINKTYGHRTITHSFFALFVVSLLGFLTGNMQIMLCLTIGYFLHLFFDMLNPSGVPLLYPSCITFVIFSGIVPIKTSREHYLFAILTIALISFMIISFYDINLVSVVRSVIYKGG